MHRAPRRLSGGNQRVAFHLRARIGSFRNGATLYVVLQDSARKRHASTVITLGDGLNVVTSEMAVDVPLVPGNGYKYTFFATENELNAPPPHILFRSGWELAATNLMVPFVSATVQGVVVEEDARTSSLTPAHVLSTTGADSRTATALVAVTTTVVVNKLKCRELRGVWDDSTKTCQLAGAHGASATTKAATSSMALPASNATAVVFDKNQCKDDAGKWSAKDKTCDMSLPKAIAACIVLGGKWWKGGGICRLTGEARKLAVVECREKYGVWMSKTSSCDTSGAQLIIKCMQAGGTWLKKLTKCKVEKGSTDAANKETGSGIVDRLPNDIHSKASCKKVWGIWDKTAAYCDITHSSDKEKCVAAGGTWNPRKINCNMKSRN